MKTSNKISRNFKKFCCCVIILLITLYAYAFGKNFTKGSAKLKTRKLKHRFHKFFALFSKSLDFCREIKIILINLQKENPVILEKTDIFTIAISVKTTFKNHNTRVAQIIDTWYQFAPQNISFVTDAFDPVLNQTVEGRLISTICASNHEQASLGCKLQNELEFMLAKNASWSCHFDDDNYVNIPILKNLLQEFNPSIPYYLGRIATNKPTVQNKRTFWFAIGGAGICLSNAALKIMAPSIKNKDLYYIYTKQEKMFDDWALGYMMDVLKIKMTEVTNFLSQYDRLESLPLWAIKDIPVFSYNEALKSFVNLPYFFNPDEDPYKFQTLHCFLYPQQCNTKLRRLRIDIYMNSLNRNNSYGTFVLPTIKS